MKIMRKNLICCALLVVQLFLIFSVLRIYAQNSSPAVNIYADEFAETDLLDDIVHLEVLEEQPAGTFVGKIPTKDGFTYRFSENLSKFQLNATSGAISTTEILDRESLRNDRFDLVVLSSQPTYPIEVRITVIDINDNAPTFPEHSTEISFTESASPGTRVILDTANDRDVGNNSLVTYDIVSGNDDGKFQLTVVINPSGETPYLHLETADYLDREVCAFYQLNISAQDTGVPSLYDFLAVDILILDVNDNPPIFDHSDYVVSLNESVPPGTKVLQVHATDSDLGNNAKLTYFLSETETKFIVLPTTGEILTQEILNCPKNCPAGGKCTKSCVFTVFAHDHGSPQQHGRTYVTVNLFDANDNDPVINFRYNPPSASFASVDENAQNGTIVAAVSIVDPDDGPSGDTRAQIIAGNELHHFRIERNHNVDIIRVNSVLDREKINQYNLTIVANDNGSPPRSSTSYLIIVVNDINDHEPVFEKHEYTSTLSELAPVGTFVASILATDEDTGINSKVFYDIVSGNENQWFHLNTITGLVTTKKLLDRENQSSVSLKISAHDGGPNPKWAFTLLHIEILDENDDVPTFNVSHQNISVLENLSANTLIASFEAKDNDQGKNGSVIYSLSDDNSIMDLELFSIDQKLGYLTAKKNLDREKSSQHVLKIIASDQGKPPLSSSLIVVINVIDENDNAPIFYPQEYYVKVHKDIAEASPIVQVSAFDADEGVNGELVYSLANGEASFVINNKTGLIVTRKSIVWGKKSSFQLSVFVQDGKGKKAEKNAVVYIMSLNHSFIEFSRIGGYSFDIIEDTVNKESSWPRELGQVNAFDRRNKEAVKYAILSGDPLGVFEINENTGIITIHHLLDREECEHYSLTVIAKAADTFSTTVVNVSVLDVNDNKPVFLRSYIQIPVKENWPIGYELYLAHAYDQDVNNSVKYNLLNFNETFFINETTGTIYLNRVVDYEKIHTFQVEVQARDNGFPPLEAQMTIVFLIEDVNDHTPFFEHLIYETSLSEATPVNSRFHLLQAVDADSGANGFISYEILGDKLEFGIFPDGYLFVQSTLDREIKDYYELTIVAVDHGSPARSSNVTVVIHVLDENDNAPKFSNSTFIYSVNENEPMGTYVGLLEASDSDIGRNAELTYSLSNSQFDFVIDHKNGFIKTNHMFDREKLIERSGQNYFLMEAVVSDNGLVRRRDETKVKVLIADVNDNAPQFLRTVFKAAVSEGAPVHTQIIRISATDADEGKNGEIRYVITEGNLEDRFKIDGITGQITVAKILDRETVDEYSLNILAHDMGAEQLSSTATVTIYVLDENDNSPEFTHIEKHVFVLENAIIGTHLGEFTAYDKDLGINGEVNFSIEGNVHEIFRIDPRTGILTLEKNLDYEMQSIYHLNISAKDGGSPHLTSSTSFSVHVVDVNDNAPNLRKTPVSRKIREGIPVHSPILNVTAEDNDSGPNGQVEYRIKSQNPPGDHFALHPNTGLLYTIKEIDREYSSTYQLTIVAKDQALPQESRLSSEKVITVFVDDINDNAPVFTSSTSVVISEEAGKGYVVITLSATDADAHENGQITYELLSDNYQDTFAVDHHSGNLYLNKPLSTQHILYNLSVRASDGAPPSRKKYTESYVTVLYATNAVPYLMFDQDKYEVDVPENETKGIAILTMAAMHASSDQSKNNPHILYFITDVISNNLHYPRFFAINSKTAVISTTVSLDRELGSSEYEINVLAIDVSLTPPVTAKTMVKVNVLDKNDSPPTFTNSSYDFFLAEDISISETVARLTADDPDVEGSVSYALLPASLDDMFVLDSATGFITLQKSLDRETNASYQLAVQASDGIHVTTVPLHIHVLDVNDNIPLFDKPVYSFDVKEDLSRGSQVGQVIATDADSGVNADIQYEIYSEGSEIFSINRNTGVIILNSHLDYEQVQYYMLVTVAKDRGYPSLSSSVTVYINVIDLNDNAPLFDPMSYSDEIYENMTVGSSLLTVSATDQDDGENGEIVYTIENDTLMFNIADNGTIFIQKPLDRETCSFYTLIVCARDQAHSPDLRLSSTVQVNVIVRDVNDNAPEFLSPNVTYVAENAVLNTVIMAVRAIDRDEGRNSYLEYSLHPVPTSLQVSQEPFPFVLGPVDGLLRLSALLDRETTSNYSIRVIAKDHGVPPLSSHLDIVVHVLDDNDNTPRFDRRYYEVSVNENIQVGVSVVTVHAADADVGQNGRIRYNIVAGDPNRDFSVGEDSGVVRIAKPLDYESQTTYVLSVQAEDGGHDARHDTATVTVVVNDINDNPPVFVDSPYEVMVMENAAIPTILTVVSAHDSDALPNNHVRYFMKDGDRSLFNINVSSGEISVMKSLDREMQDYYEMTVIAVDSGTPRLTGTGTIQILVMDVNDNEAIFSKSNYVTYVNENQPENTSIIQVNATDADLGKNSELSYSILSGNAKELFIIDSHSGWIRSKMALDYEDKSQHNLVVVARDNSRIAQKSSTALVTINVIDINDNSPKFEKTNYVAFIPDPTLAGQFVFGCTAVDADTGKYGQLKYNLQGEDVKNFLIDPASGVVRAKTNLSNETLLYHLVIEAVDFGEPPLSSTASIEIHMRLLKNFPSFQITETNFELSEAANNITVTTVRATSPKSGLSSAISYHIVGGNIGNVFSVDNFTGELKLSSGLDYETVSTCELWIEARDQDNPPMSVVIPLNITVTDVNDNSPAFEFNVYRASLMEEEHPPQGVITVKAFDADSSEYNLLKYQLNKDSNKDDIFSIDEITGKISTNTKLDREKLDLHSLIVEAVDKGDTPNTGSATLFITVLDKNDNPPRFTRLFSANVSENAAIGTFIIQVTSSDRDIGSNANALYSFTENPGETFHIDPISGNVTVAKLIDREMADEYILKVSAVDGSWQAETPLTITIQDINDNVPEFQGDNYTFSISEMQQSVTFIGRVSAIDRDKSGPNSLITYSLKQSSDLFEIDGITGDIFSKTKLYYKANRLRYSPENQFVLHVIATDHGKPPLASKCVVFVNVIDANKNTPKFKEDNHVLSLPFTASVGLPVFQIIAEDVDYGANGEVDYFIIGGNGTSYFNISQKNGDIIVSSPLNTSKDQTLFLHIKAADGGIPSRTAETFVKFTITEENRYSPVFSSPSYQVIIPENELINSQIFAVTATDNDIGINGEVFYSIIDGNKDENFIINSSTGIISIKEILDYEAVQEYQLKIAATDKAFNKRQAITFLTIVVTDVNDNPPVFNQSSYDASIAENLPPNITVTKITASDPDSGRNAAIQYSVTGGDGINFFAIDLQTGTIVTKTMFDFEMKKKYYLEIMASNPDSVQYTSCIVVVHILGKNEYFPKFLQSIYHFTVSEFAKVGTSVGTVTASDEDHGADGKIFYLLLGNNNAKGFSVNSYTGVISVMSSIKNDLHLPITLSILAKNNGPIRGNDTDEAQIIIKIQHENEVSLFSQSLYEVYVPENVSIGEKILSLSLALKKVDSRNNHFTYSILSGNDDSVFKVDPLDGTITVEEQLDHERVSLYNLSVYVVDDSISMQSGTAIVKVSVEDINDNGPWIPEKERIGYVTENEPPGTVVMILKPTDADSSSFGAPFSFFINDTNMAEIFAINKENGTITTKKILDREKIHKYSIPVVITDSGIIPMSSSYQIEVHVRDQNDNPSFPRNATILVYAVEGITYNSKIADVHPLDMDTANNFHCELVENEKKIMFDLPSACNLHALQIRNNSNVVLAISGNDGIHTSVTSLFNISFRTFFGQILENLINVHVENISSTYFISNHYVPLKALLEEMFDLEKYQPIIVGIATANNSLDIFIAAEENQNKQISKKDLKHVLNSGKNRMKKLMKPNNVVVDYYPCQEKPCKNNAQCSNKISILQNFTSIDSSSLVVTMPTITHELTCICASGFKGRFCEIQIDLCNPNPCLHGGTCNQHKDKWHCTCPQNYYGQLCDKEKRKGCFQYPCFNGGICNSTASPVCLCSSGFRGARCEIAAENCHPNPCKNGGKCHTGKSEYICSCEEDYFGVHCEKSPFGFHEMSSMTFPPLDSDIIDLTIIFSSLKSSGLLLYTHEVGYESQSNFVALEIINNIVKFSIGSFRRSVISITVNKVLILGKWYKINIRRIGKVFSLFVSDCNAYGEICNDCSSKNYNCFNESVAHLGLPQFSSEPLYIGGIQQVETLVNHFEHVAADDFIGCIYRININRKELDLSRPVNSVGVTQNCPKPKITCDSGICKDGKCFNETYKHQCLCQNGLLAFDCSESFQSISLNGNSYILFKVKELHKRHQLLPHLYKSKQIYKRHVISHPVEKGMSLMFRTVQLNSVLIYSTSKDDFTLIYIQDGFLMYKSRLDLHKKINVSFADVFVSNGEWHNVSITRSEAFVSISIDNKIEKINATQVHDFLDPYLTKLIIGSTGDDSSKLPDSPSGLDGCLSTFVINGEVQPLNGSGNLFNAVVYGKLQVSCEGTVQSQDGTPTDPLSVGVTLVIIFFVVLMIVIMISFIVFRHRRLKKDKLEGNSNHLKQNGNTLLASNVGDNLRNYQVATFISTTDGMTEDALNNHLVNHDVTSKKQKDRDFNDMPQRPDIIEREVLCKSSIVSSLRMGDCSPMMDARNRSTLGEIQDSEAPEHYDLENASSIAPSDIDIVYHYKGYRDGNVRKYKTNPHLPNFHKHNHRHSPHQHHSNNTGGNNGPVHCRNNLLRQSPNCIQIRESPSILKMQSTPLARLSPSSELSQQTPRILTLQDISGRPLQTALLATSQSAGVTDPMTNSERSLNSPVSQLSRSTSSMHSKEQIKGSVSIGLTTEEIERLNSRPRNSSLVSTLDVVSSSSDGHGTNKHQLAELLETNTELLDAQDSLTDESGNDSFTCSEFEYDNNYDRVAREFGPGNMIFSKLAEVDNENDEDSPKNFDNFDSFHGSVSTLVASDDDISNLSSYKPSDGSNLGWDYLLNWGPNFENLVGVFKDIAELPISGKSTTKSEEYV